MFVQAWVNGKKVLAMMDTGATHNFIAQREVRTFGLQLGKSSSKLKAVNSSAIPMNGNAEVNLKVGLWEGRVSMTAIPLDDFDVILENEFFVNAKVALMPYLNEMLISHEKATCFVPSEKVANQSKKDGKRKVEILSALQVDAGL